ncbi:tRNA (adenosine(37)-N6)-threonylcarbamoyltransferase complex dimerization subunit type 1 TsaB [Paenibacillus spiritus]|uniref:tRNA (Adenosine(37)-N6)-threonylcarbamoyltransferase complex dimerization subunit type 1 TsaB n=1 Tax=Paenibacillus spiritus TaxID=2496557 RepID=A0A5J5GA90_9BACL|nr:tRNA (adenosine(37)-N6)-threonylcarbamoyltransferase complex dimerization subunit type 1 TsaB [Paenibacillus spiritus]KAA9004813.1 tRNA (adenosine(37)-N6)-threonylcarbamoyltransferase complex dimerization subunit type 1 TsaB [Paenibacillus spiritus]
MNHDKSEPRKRLLALDTATAVLGVSVTENGRTLHEINAAGERNHSVHLLPLIGEALSASRTSGPKLAGIAVGIGPGSYTGTRIAVTAAKSLAWAWKVPVCGVSTLHALAWCGWSRAAGLDGGRRYSAEPRPEALAEPANAAAAYWIVPMLEARRGQTYTALFAAGGDRPAGAPPQRLAPDAIRLTADWLPELAGMLRDAEASGTAPGAVWFVGEPQKHTSAEQLAPLEGLAQAQAVPCELEGRWVGLLGELRLLEQPEGEDVHSLIPNYTQLSEAEANLRRAAAKEAGNT